MPSLETKIVGPQIEGRAKGAFRAQGDLELARKNWTEAERHYKRAIELNPRGWSLHFALGNLYYRLSKYEEAEKSFIETINSAPDSNVGYRNLGVIYHLQGRFGEASAQFQKALQIKASPVTYSNLGTSLFFQGLYKESVEAMEKAIALGANNYVNWANLGDAYRWTPGNEEKSREAFQTAIRLIRDELSGKPNDPDMRSRLALYLAKSGEKGQALAEISALDAASKNAQVLARLVLVYEICGQRARALEAMASALEAGHSAVEFGRDPELLEMRKDPNYHKLAVRFSGTPKKE